MEFKEIAGTIKTEAPKFFINFVAIFSAPSKNLPLVLQKKKKKEAAITAAFIYFSLCVIIVQVFLFPIYGMEVWAEKNLIYSLLTPIIFLLLSAAVLKISWKIVRYNASFWDYFILFCYQIGTLFTIFFFLFFVAIAFLRYHDPVKFTQAIGNNFFGHENQIIYDYNSPVDLIYILLSAFAMVFSLIWFYRSWACYRYFHKSGRGISILVAILFTVFSVGVWYLDMIVSKALRP